MADDESTTDDECNGVYIEEECMTNNDGEHDGGEHKHGGGQQMGKEQQRQCYIEEHGT